MDRHKIYYEEGEEESDLLRDRKAKKGLPLLKRLALLGSTLLLGATTSFDFGASRGESAQADRSSQTQENFGRWREHLVDKTREFDREFVHSNNFMTVMEPNEQYTYFRTKEELLSETPDQTETVSDTVPQTIPLLESSLIIVDKKLVGIHIITHLSNGNLFDGYVPAYEVGLWLVREHPIGVAMNSKGK